MNSIIQDIRYGWKLLRRDRGLTFVAILSLALGLGANTAIFSVANAFLLRPLAVEEPERLVSLFGSAEGVRYAMTSYPDFVDWRDQNDVFSGLAAYAWLPIALKVSGGGPAEVIAGELVTGNYFSVLGVEPVLGRAFLPEEDSTPGTHPVAVISHGLWKRRFGSDRNVVGKNVRINGLKFTVIGVAPEGFIDITVGIAPDVWVPLMMESQIFPYPTSLLDQRDSRWLQVVGRLKQAVSREKATSAMDILASNLEQEYPQSNKGFGTALVEANRNRIPLILTQGVGITGFMGVLLVLVGLVLLIACSNVASLLLARTSRRWREMALRQSLGAGRGRIIRQLLTESLMLSAAGGLAGLLVAVWGIDLLQAFEPPVSFPMAFDLSLDWRVLGYTAFLSVLTGVVFGLAPALQTTKKDQSAALNDPGQWLGLRKGRSRPRSFIVTAQVAFAVVSLVSAGLFLRSAQNARTIDPGFDPDHVLCASLNLGLGQYDEPSGRRFYREVIDQIESLPSVQSATLAQTVPLGLVNRSMAEVTVDGYEPAQGERMFFYYNSVGPRYFETLGIPIVKGRGISAGDREDAALVAVINEAMARRFWPGEDPLGRTFDAGGIDLEVIGIAKNGKYLTLGERPRPYFYVPLMQNYVEMVSLHVSTFGDPGVDCHFRDTRDRGSRY